jgi:hypothetical protein
LIADTGFTSMLGGIKHPEWSEEWTTLFFDTSSENQPGKTPQIATEATYGGAPFEIILKVRDKVPSGSHNIQFFLTYYNGSEWKVDSQTVSIFVRNLVRRHETIAWSVALIAGLSALAPGATLIVEFIVNLLRHLAAFLGSPPGT